MSIAAPNAASFYREVAAARVVWAIRDSAGFPAPINGDKKRAMPFWSSKSRALQIITNVEAYRDFRPEPIAWETFNQRWIPGLMKDGMLAGLNWSGPNATGYDVEPTDIERNVLALLNQPVAQPIIPPDATR
ncbi:DUF2750 domain-containing protein (plasmid) [Methylomonas sp. HW2-6]|uniref:DUF2750 domain-containing protein n=1 Tax=Methylomonas sp. HW2-6 TaxID=3376687 RepID=UPI0040429CBE